jgi:quercetin dioxygenase-like cupin family protein
MARPGDVIENPRIGARIVFLRTGAETSGQLLEVDLFLQPGGKAPPKHLHPNHEERIRVVNGSLTTWVAGQQSVLATGQECVVPKGCVHTVWNSGDCEAQVHGEFRPAARTERLEAISAFAQDGVRNPLQYAVTFWGFRQDTTLPGLAPKVLLPCLAALGKLLGYKAEYPYPYERAKSQQGQN